ncbi:MarR family winged helix-turn-helix transcriptional regulator [Gulosibacter sp. 10]|uniref:MarR family winged helix-turn-helix transcriptional regulator n=1 Tax=Gulosibacter sp. 10 TaxID=1255570 RepID=UPI00097F46E2|nr:MarR family transcriptional regulator [Gulosibacter sp. 10]SJM53672.1 Transcriptional regulator, MarR family [Gulosibacter sp. 10]
MDNGHGIADSLSELLEQLVHRLRDQASDEQLSRAWTTALSRLDNEGPLPVTRLAHAVGVSQPAMTQLVDRMAAEGFVLRAASEQDRRVQLVEITEAGRSAIDARRRWRASRLDDRLRTLDPADRAAVAGAIPALERLVESLARPDAEDHDKKEEAQH